MPLILSHPFLSPPLQKILFTLSPFFSPPFPYDVVVCTRGKLSFLPPLLSAFPPLPLTLADTSSRPTEEEQGLVVQLGHKHLASYTKRLRSTDLS